MQRIALITSMVAAAAGACAPAAGAATLYAAPAGSGAACAATAPCSLAGAVAVAHAGDDVAVASGDYATPSVAACDTNAPSSGLQVPVGVIVHGVDGQPRPRISPAGSPCFTVAVAGAGATLRGVRVESAIAGSTRALTGALLDRDVLTAVELHDGATLTNSAVLNLGGAAVTASGGTVTLANDTLHSGLAARADAASGATTVSATNVIVLGTVSAASDNTAGVAATIDMDHSNYAFAQVVEFAGDDHVSPGAGVQDGEALPPALTGTGSDDHEVATSPTIDAGTAAPAAGQLDFDGGVRALGVTDIGADEFGADYVPPAQPGGPAGAGAPAGPQQGTSSIGPIHPPRCVVPRLAGKTLAQARRALQRAHCRLGKVTRARGVRHPVVIATTPKAKRRLKSAAHVAVRLGRRSRR